MPFDNLKDDTWDRQKELEVGKVFDLHYAEGEWQTAALKAYEELETTLWWVLAICLLVLAWCML